MAKKIKGFKESSKAAPMNDTVRLNNLDNVVELSITLKDEERTLTLKHIIYGEIIMDPNDFVLQGLIKEAVEEFGGDLESSSPKITVRASLVVQD